MRVRAEADGGGGGEKKKLGKIVSKCAGRRMIGIGERKSLSLSLSPTTSPNTHPGRDRPAPSHGRDGPDGAAGPRRRVGEGRVAIGSSGAGSSSSSRSVSDVATAAPATGASVAGRRRGGGSRDSSAIRCRGCDSGAARPSRAGRRGASSGAGRGRSTSSIRPPRRSPRLRRGCCCLLLRIVRLL